MTIDLHSHTTASDGELSPSDLVKTAHEHGVTVLAVTDHDTTDGIPEAQSQAEALGMTLVHGIELSAESPEDGDVHMLGYFIDITDEAFQERLKQFRENRYHRARGMVRKLNELGIPVEWETVQAIAGDAAIARPHVARALMRGGYVESMQDAFDKYIADDGPAYVNRERMLPEEAIDLIHSVGGVAVMAHPGLVDKYEVMLRRLAKNGLDGVEVNHPRNPPEVTEHVTQIATEFGLIMTGGSDFHRPERSTGEIKLGKYNPPSDEALAQLRQRSGKA